jgi:glycosyltransferase involved in cell wall biosynthesis
MKKNNLPLVSIIIPVFNGSDYLGEAIESIHKSSFINYEILLIDDGSTDKSRQLCHKLEKKYKKIRFYSFSKNKGLGRVLNFALNKAKGKYICRLNQDDIMLSSRIKTQVDFLNKNSEIVAVGSYIEYFGDKKQVLKFFQKDEEIRQLIHVVSPFSDPSVMYRKQTALKIGGYFQEMWPADDTHLWIRMTQVGKLANIPKVLVKVRWHEKAASIKYFRTLAISTYKMHLWVDDNIQRAPFSTHIYWIIQLLAGLLLPPKLNWEIYTFLKKIFDIRIILPKLIIQPKRLSISGI